jgi:hypothetical protein
MQQGEELEAMAVGDLDWLIWTKRRKANARKLRLFACACCRRLWPLLEDERSRRAVEVSEQFSDGMVSRKTLAAVRAAAPARGTTRAKDWAAKAAAYATAAGAYYAAERTAAAARQTAQAADVAVHETSLIALLQHITEIAPPARLVHGDPDNLRSFFEKCARWADVGKTTWPGTVLQLAESLYAGEDCCFALHDALLEAGHAELAEHFQEKEHPKGCWALDLVLGKE